MSIYHINPTAAAGGDGTSTRPLRELPQSLAAGDVLRLPRGLVVPVQPRTFEVPAGIGVGLETTVEAWDVGAGSAAPVLLAGTTDITSVFFNILDPRHIKISDVTCVGAAYAFKVTPTGASFSSQNVTFRRVRGERQYAYGMLFSTDALATSGLDGIEVWDSVMYEAQQAGFHIYGAIAGNIAGTVPRTYGVKYFRSHALYCGRGWPAGGFSSGAHGFSNIPYRDTIKRDQLTNVAGNVFSFAQPVGVVNIWRFANAPVIANNIGLYAQLSQNTLTPTTPGPGEWGVSGSTYYLNWNTPTLPGTGSDPIFGYAWGLSGGAYYEECSAIGSIDLSSNNAEGHGMAADDYRSNCTYVRCLMKDNEGYGFSSHRGERNEWFYCVFDHNNLKLSWADFTLTSGVGHRMHHCSFVNSASPSLPQLNFNACQFDEFANILFDGSTANCLGGSANGLTASPFGVVDNAALIRGIATGQKSSSIIITTVTGHDFIRANVTKFIGKGYEPVRNSAVSSHGTKIDAVYDRKNAWEAGRPQDFVQFRNPYNIGFDGREMSSIGRSIGAVQSFRKFTPPAKISRRLSWAMNKAGGTLRIDASSVNWAAAGKLSLEIWWLRGPHNSPNANAANVIIGSGVPTGGNTRHLTLYDRSDIEPRFFVRPTNNASPERSAQLQGMEVRHLPYQHWTHVIVCLDVAAQTVRFFTNGMGLSAGWVAQVAADDALPNMDQITLGGNTDAEAISNGLGNFRMWNRVLTDLEAAELYATGTIANRANLQYEFLFPTGSELVNTGLAGGSAVAVGVPTFLPMKAF